MRMDLRFQETQFSMQAFAFRASPLLNQPQAERDEQHGKKDEEIVTEHQQTLPAMPLRRIQFDLERGRRFLTHEDRLARLQMEMGTIKVKEVGHHINRHQRDNDHRDENTVSAGGEQARDQEVVAQVKKTEHQDVRDQVPQGHLRPKELVPGQLAQRGPHVQDRQREKQQAAQDVYRKERKRTLHTGYSNVRFPALAGGILRGNGRFLRQNRAVRAAVSRSTAPFRKSASLPRSPRRTREACSEHLSCSGWIPG